MAIFLQLRLVAEILKCCCLSFVLIHLALCIYLSQYLVCLIAFLVFTTQHLQLYIYICTYTTIDCLQLIYNCTKAIANHKKSILQEKQIPLIKTHTHLILMQKNITRHQQQQRKAVATTVNKSCKRKLDSISQAVSHCNLQQLLLLPA